MSPNKKQLTVTLEFRNIGCLKNERKDKMKSYVINKSDFKVTEWKSTIHNGETIEYRECYELIHGRWEGFISIRKVK